LYDIGVLELKLDFGFVDEADADQGIFAPLGEQDLDGHGLLQELVAGSVEPGHPASLDELLDVVVTLDCRSFEAFSHTLKGIYRACCLH
jgi:hypothetical protein